ncbi:hypothetical protein ACS2S4_27410, partial [Bacillus cereus group sp. BC60]
LFEQNAASRLDLDNAIASYESAKAEVAMSEADLTQAEIALGYTTVRSPISGFISERTLTSEPSSVPAESHCSQP